MVYVYVYPRIEEAGSKEQTTASFYGVLIGCCVGIFFVALIFVAASIRIVPENTRLSVYRLRLYIGDKGPGLVFLIPAIDHGVQKAIGTDAGNASDQEGRT